MELNFTQNFRDLQREKMRGPIRKLGKISSVGPVLIGQGVMALN